ncbi:uncharacterized protein KIAA2012-like [Labrus mixtus]|uniref:uncharacterized protein KIAA2012-like n=1 Tax=Labrus mixtus TaxID=508554 RepID=UPI0029C0EA36|nr:uncharacterized protein KIAA2012-like [Labrus mixtus]
MILESCGINEIKEVGQSSQYVQILSFFADKEEEQGSRKRVRLDLFLQVPCSTRTPSPLMEPQPWVHYVAMTPEEPLTYVDISPQQPDCSQNIKTNDPSMGEKLHHQNSDCDESEDQDGHQAERRSADMSEKSRSRNWHRRTVRPRGVKQQASPEPETNTTSGLLPPLTGGQPVSPGAFWEKSDTLRREGPSRDERHTQLLPPIPESRTGTPDSPTKVQTQHDVQQRSKRIGYQCRDDLKRLHQQPLSLPQLVHEELSGKKKSGGGERSQRHYLRKETVGHGGGRGGAGGRGGGRGEGGGGRGGGRGEGGGGRGGGRGEGGGGRLPSERGSVILLAPGAEPPPAGVLGCVVGRKGPGKQTSLAFLQNQLLDLQDSGAPGDDNRGVVRGVLPLELRDLQNGRSVGCLIVGPDGEILRLSLYDNSQDETASDGETREQALQVLSPEGDKLPWVIMLQPENTHTGGSEQNTHLPDEHVPLHQSIPQLSDVHRSADVFPPSSLTDPVAQTRKKTKSAEAAVDMWKSGLKGARNSVRMPPLRERVVSTERGGDAEDEDEDEGLQQPGQQNIEPIEATSEDALRKNAEGAAVTTRSDVKTGKSEELDGGKKASRMRTEGRSEKEKTGRDAPSVVSRRREERTLRGAAETKAPSARPPHMTDVNGKRGEEQKNEEREGRGEEVRRRQESAGNRRRRRLKHKDLVLGSPEDSLENQEAETDQELKEESHLASPTNPSAAQNHKNRTNSEGDAAETDHLYTDADKHGSVRSVSSLRSTAAASQSTLKSSRRSVASSCEGAGPASALGLTSSHGRLSSCSTVMVTEEQLMLNPVKPEPSKPRKSQREEEEEAAALRLAQRAEKRRQEVERKRREREEEARRQLEREQTEDRMKSELEEERRRRAEELRLKRMAEEEKRRKQEEEEQARERREQEQRERERRRQEEKMRQMERLQKMREEEEQRRRAELERLRQEEETRQEEENRKLQEMDESERVEYLSRKEQEEEERRKNEEERRRREEEAALQAAEDAKLQAELLARQMALLQQQLAFKRGLMSEAGGLEKTQGISRPWVYSYFTLLQLLGLKPT